MYCHQNALFHTIHWPNKYILIPSLATSHNLKAPAVGKGNSARTLVDNDKSSKHIILLLTKAPFPINLLVQPHCNSPKN